MNWKINIKCVWDRRKKQRENLLLTVGKKMERQEEERIYDKKISSSLRTILPYNIKMS